MIKIDVLAIGSFQRDENGKVFDAHSNSTLVRSDDRTIVVDTSTDFMRPAMKTSFKQIGVFPKDVDTVILTHSHGDHVGNNDMFQNAKILMHSAEEKKVEGAVLFDKDMEIDKGIRIVHTPGHTRGSVSVFIEADKKYVIAGDALPRRGNYENMSPPVIHYNENIALESIKMISKYADMIVPGHDQPFVTKK
jgi:Zn-dependent hydrolases, including glyoxylases